MSASGQGEPWRAPDRHGRCTSDSRPLPANSHVGGAAAAAKSITVSSFERRKPARRPVPAHLARERIVYPAPAVCPCCGDERLRKIGEDVTETLELIPRQWKVIAHVHEKFSCRACEAITQAPAPRLLSHPGLPLCGSGRSFRCKPQSPTQSSERRPRIT